MFALYQAGTSGFIGTGATEQDARNNARNCGYMEEANVAQLVRAGDEFSGGYYIRECSPRYADSYRQRGKTPWVVNTEGLIDVDPMS